MDRAPRMDSVHVSIVGGDFGGRLAGARLTEAGVGGLRMVEKAADFGGTGYWNRCPGAACDIESHVYRTLLEETGYLPKRKYTTGEEILCYSREIAGRFGLYGDALFQTEVTALRWDQSAEPWAVETNRGDAIRSCRRRTPRTRPWRRCCGRSSSPTSRRWNRSADAPRNSWRTRRLRSL